MGVVVAEGGGGDKKLSSQDVLFCEGGFGIGWEREEEEKKIEERLMKVIHHSNLQQRRGKGKKGMGEGSEICQTLRKKLK